MCSLSNLSPQKNVASLRLRGLPEVGAFHRRYSVLAFRRSSAAAATRFTDSNPQGRPEAVAPSHPWPDLFFVRSTSLYVVRGAGVGGSGSPRVTVTSFPA